MHSTECPLLHYSYNGEKTAAMAHS